MSQPWMHAEAGHWTGAGTADAPPEMLAATRAAEDRAWCERIAADAAADAAWRKALVARLMDEGAITAEEVEELDS